MSYTFAYGTGGEFIRPSARISIHHHSGCIFAETERMARFAFEPTRHRNHQANSQQNVASNDNNCSVDEVDNVMSKPAQPIQPPKPRNKDVRRGSFDLVCNGQSYHDESANDVLSKSVPTMLPSQLYSSISSEDDDETYETLNSSHCSSRFEESISERSLKQKNKTFFSKATIWLIGVVFALCAIVCSGVFNVQNNSAAKYDKARFFTDLSALGEKYNIDENSILKIQMGISTISDKEDTGSFIFVYNSKFNFFNVEEFYNFVSDISLTAAKYLRNESRSAHYTTVDGARLDMDEHSDFMCKYREQFTHSGVMLVRNLEAVPSRLAMAFHYYCDEYNPVVRRSAVLCTLDLATCDAGEPTTSKSLHSTIEACLRKRWTTISPDSISPLLTRVVNVLVDVSKAFSKD